MSYIIVHRNDNFTLSLDRPCECDAQPHDISGNWARYEEGQVDGCRGGPGVGGMMVDPDADVLGATSRRVVLKSMRLP